MNDLALLEAVQGGLFWRDLHGGWRHNTRDVTEAELGMLPRVAVCEPGRTARLTDEGWEQLHPELAGSAPNEENGSDRRRAMNEKTDPVSERLTHGEPPWTHGNAQSRLDRRSGSG